MEQPDLRPLLLDDWEVEYYGIAKDRAYVLNAPYEFVWRDAKSTERKLSLAAGLIVDGASVPRVAWSLSGLTPDGLLRAAATLHDFLYHNAGSVPYSMHAARLPGLGLWGNEPAVFSRLAADTLFKYVLVLAGVPAWKAQLAYAAVRTFGGSSWGSRKGKDHVYEAHKAHDRLRNDPTYADSVRRKYSRSNGL
jgi:hypothetical protein